MSIPAGIECVNLRGRSHPLTGAVLVYAQEKKYLRSLEVSLTQAPTEENGWMAICSATAVFAPPDQEAQVYTDIGDASPKSTGAQMVPHLCRLASTRAIGRVLRWGCGITQAVFEEMGEGGEPPEAEASPASENPSRRQGFYNPPAVPATSQRQVASENTAVVKGTGKFCEHEGCGVELAGPEVGESFKLWKRFYCPAHSQELREKLASNPAI